MRRVGRFQVQCITRATMPDGSFREHAKEEMRTVYEDANGQFVKTYVPGPRKHYLDNEDRYVVEVRAVRQMTGADLIERINRQSTGGN